MLIEIPAALLHKLRTVQREGLLAPNAVTPPPSPCISVCRMDAAQQYCAGCLRTMDELRAWGTANPRTKRQIWQHIQARCGLEP